MLADNLYSRNVMLVFAFIPYLLASLFALVIGLVLWGWGRWRIVLGVMLCIVGAYVIMASGMLAGLKYLPELGMPTTGPSLPDLGLRPAYAGIVGVILIGLGILSILRQRHQDKLAVLLPNQ
jgi:glucan phosphoethanolaminetransferase (alkaline phosphatase superfamily)